MTRLLYQTDSYLQQFSACVTGCVPAAEKGRWQVTLDATAFYPEGGGQPADRGTLGTAQVLDVREKEGRVLHLTDAPLTVGQQVEGQVDFDRRFDHMQQHTAEHIVSGLIHEKFGWNNVGFHLGAETVTIDLDGPITPDQLDELEQAANRVVFENRPVTAWWPDDAALAATDYRSKKPIDGAVRLVKVPGADLCACCGTHLSYTGEAGLIKFLGAQNYKGGVRITLAAGRRAVRYSMQEHAQIAAVSALLSAKQHEIAAAVEKLAQKEAAARERANRAMGELLQLKAERYAGKEQAVCLEEGLDGDGLRRYAQLLRDAGCKTALIFSMGENGINWALSGEDEPVCAQLADRLRRELGCKGGGRNGFYQGRCGADEAAVRAFAAAL